MIFPYLLDLGHYYALTYNHNTGIWTKFNDTKIRELSHEEGYNFVRGIFSFNFQLKIKEL